MVGQPMCPSRSRSPHLRPGSSTSSPIRGGTWKSTVRTCCGAALTGPTVWASGRSSSFDALWRVPYRVHNRVVEFEENRLIAWRHFEPQHVALRTRAHRIRHRVTETFDYSCWPLTGRLLLRPALGWPIRNKPAITKTLALLARTAQTSTTEANG